MGLGDFLENVVDNVTMFPRFVESFSESVDDLANGTSIICDESAKEMRGIARGISVDFASKISPEAGEMLEKAHEIEDKAREGIHSLFATIANPIDAAIPKFSIKGTNDLNRGDHIYVVSLNLFTHHGIYMGDEMVAHYSPEEAQEIYIHLVSFEEFANGRDVYKKSKSQSPTRYDCQEIVDRANSRVYEESYNLLFNNCEHFAKWCRFGD